MALNQFQLPRPLVRDTPASASDVTIDIVAAANWGAQAVNTQLSPQAMLALASLGITATSVDAAIMALVALIGPTPPAPPSGGGSSDFSQPGNPSQLPLMAG